MASERLIKLLLEQYKSEKYTNPTESELTTWFKDLPDRFIVQVMDETNPVTIWGLQTALYEQVMYDCEVNALEIGSHILGFASWEDRKNKVEEIKEMMRKV